MRSAHGTARYGTARHAGGRLCCGLIRSQPGGARSKYALDAHRWSLLRARYSSSTFRSSSGETRNCRYATQTGGQRAVRAVSQARPVGVGSAPSAQSAPRPSARLDSHGATVEREREAAAGRRWKLFTAVGWGARRSAVLLCEKLVGTRRELDFDFFGLGWEVVGPERKRAGWEGRAEG